MLTQNNPIASLPAFAHFQDGHEARRQGPADQQSAQLVGVCLHHHHDRLTGPRCPRRTPTTYVSRFNLDYHAEDADGGQRPIAHVFERDEWGVHHCYSSELRFVPPEPGESPRHVDAMWPLWNDFDLTPIGRGTEWCLSLCIQSSPNRRLAAVRVL